MGYQVGNEETPIQTSAQGSQATNSRSIFGGVNASTPKTTANNGSSFSSVTEQASDPVTSKDDGIGVIPSDENVFMGLSFYGTDADGEGFRFKVSGWRWSSHRNLWVRYPIAEGDGLLSSASLGDLTNGFYADTINITTDNGADPLNTVALAAFDNEPATLFIDRTGYAAIQVEVTRDVTGVASTPDACAAIGGEYYTF